MIYLQDIIDGADSGSDDSDFDAPNADAEYDSDVNDFCSVSSSELEEEVIDEPPEHRPGEDLHSGGPTTTAAYGLLAGEHRNNQQSAIATLPSESTAPPTLPTTTEPVPTVPRGKSIAYHDFANGKIVLLSFDLETGGEYCGIVQFSGQLFRPNSSLTSFDIEPDTFNRYVKPPDGVFWNEAACRASHGLTATSPQIQSGSPFVTVWEDVTSWVSQHVDKDEKCILCAYRGETCDLRWIWRHTQAARSQLMMPDQVSYFMDPLEVIKTYSGCKLHPSKSKLESLELGCVYKHITGSNLNGAHDSLVDVRAQTAVITSKDFVPYINKTKSIRLIQDIFSRAEQREMLKRLEPLRPVHSPWVELVEGEPYHATISPNDRYTGPSGGGDGHL